MSDEIKASSTRKWHPRSPVYIPSKGRADKPMTARMFDRDGVDYRMVVQPDQVEAYKEWEERGMLLVLPENDKGLVYARNWIRDHAQSEGHEWHWQWDDDVRRTAMVWNGYRIPCDSAIALRAAEDFANRYENVGVASLNSTFFVVVNGVTMASEYKPYFLNARCYTNFLFRNDMPARWRFRYNEDTDMTLQVLARGYCTVLLNAFLMETEGTENNSTGNREGGGQAAVYDGDGRLKMARELERVWPGVVSTKRRFGRPQHVVKDHWTKFDTQLKLKRGAEPMPDYGLRLVQVADEIKSDEMRRLLEDQDQ